MKLAELLENIGKGFTIVFVILLSSAAVVLAVGDEATANILAEYAYYSLVVAVSLLLVATVMGEKGGPEIRLEIPRLGLADMRKTVGLLLSLAGFLAVLADLGLDAGLASVPGRPTLVIGWDSLAPAARMAYTVMAAIGGLGLALIWQPLYGIIASGLGVAALAVNSPALSVAALTPYTMIILRKSVVLAAIASLASFIALLASLTGMFPPITFAWSVIGGLTGIGFVLGFVALVYTLYAWIAEKGSIGVRSETPLRLARHDIISLALGIAFVAITFSSVHVAVDGIVSLDTVFNLRRCGVVSWEAGVEWARPLYVLVVCGLRALLGIDPVFYFDFLVPLVGLSLLVLSIFFTLKEVGYDGVKLLIAILYSISYWAPFFIYAGFQTNLLALPIAFTLSSLIFKRRLPSLLASALLSVILSLWHPWTFVYYTVAIVFALLLERWPLKEFVKAILALLPGWLIQPILAPNSVEAVAKTVASAVSVSKQFSWGIAVFAWGTSLRPEVVFVAAGLATAYLLVKGLPAVPSWVYSASLLAFLGLVLPNGALAVRLLVDAPLPLLAVMLVERYGGRGLAPFILLALASVFTCAAILARIGPVA